MSRFRICWNHQHILGSGPAAPDCGASSQFDTTKPLIYSIGSGNHIAVGPTRIFVFVKRTCKVKTTHNKQNLISCARGSRIAVGGGAVLFSGPDCARVCVCVCVCFSLSDCLLLYISLPLLLFLCVSTLSSCSLSSTTISPFRFGSVSVSGPSLYDMFSQHRCSSG